NAISTVPARARTDLTMTVSVFSFDRNPYVRINISTLQISWESSGLVSAARLTNLIRHFVAVHHGLDVVTGAVLTLLESGHVLDALTVEVQSNDRLTVVVVQQHREVALSVAVHHPLRSHLGYSDSPHDVEAL